MRGFGKERREGTVSKELCGPSGCSVALGFGNGDGNGGGVQESRGHINLPSAVRSVKNLHTSSVDRPPTLISAARFLDRL